MGEILHHLTCMKPCRWWDILLINWCRISSINSMIMKLKLIVKLLLFVKVSFKEKIDHIGWPKKCMWLFPEFVLQHCWHWVKENGLVPSSNRLGNLRLEPDHWSEPLDLKLPNKRSIPTQLFNSFTMENGHYRMLQWLQLQLDILASLAWTHQHLAMQGHTQLQLDMELQLDIEGQVHYLDMQGQDQQHLLFLFHGFLLPKMMPLSRSPHPHPAFWKKTRQSERQKMREANYVLEFNLMHPIHISPGAWCFPDVEKCSRIRATVEAFSSDFGEVFLARTNLQTKWKLKYFSCPRKFHLFQKISCFWFRPLSFVGVGNF